MTQQERAARYISKLPPAIAGQGGHAATFAAACRLVEFGLTEAAALAVLLEWNGTHCEPPWSEGELRHKLADAFRTTQPKEGFTSPATSSRRPWNPERAKPFPSRERAATIPARLTDRRPVLPMLHKGTAPELAQLSRLRCLSLTGLSLASERGLLRFGSYRGHASWFVLDRARRISQARRMDGELWAVRDTKEKSLSVSGSNGHWPVGTLEAEAFPVIAFCEGGPDLLAAHHFIAAQSRAQDCAAVAIVAGSASIHADALRVFKGKRVRIFRHVDTAGDNATAKWAAQLEAAGADVDAFALDGLSRADGRPVNDLNDLTQVSAAELAAHPCLLSLFP